jgi:hypothetical protein
MEKMTLAWINIFASVVFALHSQAFVQKRKTT